MNEPSNSQHTEGGTKPGNAANAEGAKGAGGKDSVLNSIQEQAAQLLREGKHLEARRVLKRSEKLRQEEQRTQWLAEVQVEREKALELTDAGQLEEAQRALERAAELERKALGGFKQTMQMLGSVQSKMPKWPRKAEEAAKEKGAEQPPADPVEASLAIVGQHAKMAAVVGLLPGGLINFIGIFSIQVPMVIRISKAFGQNVSRSDVRGVLVSLFSSIIPGLVGQGTGMAIGSVTAKATGLVISIIATPILAYAVTRAVGNTFIMHFESGGNLLNFDPKAFTEYFVNEFKKAGGKVKEAEAAPAAGLPENEVAVA